MTSKKILSLLLGGALLAIPVLSSAHGIWIAERTSQTQLVLGEGPEDLSYQPESVTSVQGFDIAYKKTSVELVNKGNSLALLPSEKTAILATSFDYGYWSKSIQGSFIQEPMTKVPGSTVGTHAIKYNIAYLQPVDNIQEIPTIPIQIIPQTDPLRLNRDEQLPILVKRNGKPLANVPIMIDVVNNPDLTVMTDSAGKATITIPNQGLNVIGIEIAFPLKNDPKATQEKFFSTLSFTLTPDEED